MDQHDPQRRAAQYRVDQLARREGPDRGDDAADGRPAHGPAGAAPSAEPSAQPAAQPSAPRPPSMAARGAFADELVRQAMLRGEFDDLPLTGKPIPGLTGRHDPDWWLKAFIEREQITGVLPEALQLRNDDAALDDRLDREHREERVREMVTEFNARIVEARRQLLGGPPVVTPTRDVEAEVDRWRERRRDRRAQAQERAAAEAEAARASGGDRRRGWSRGWWRRAGDTRTRTSTARARPER